MRYCCFCTVVFYNLCNVCDAAVVLFTKNFYLQDRQSITPSTKKSRNVFENGSSESERTFQATGCCKTISRQLTQISIREFLAKKNIPTLPHPRHGEAQDMSGDLKQIKQTKNTYNTRELPLRSTANKNWNYQNQVYLCCRHCWPIFCYRDLHSNTKSLIREAVCFNIAERTASPLQLYMLQCNNRTRYNAQQLYMLQQTTE
jgi:hypothetical protein